MSNVVRLVTPKQRQQMIDEAATMAYVAIDTVRIGEHARSIRMLYGLDAALKALGDVAQDLRNEGRKT